jgi:hypothetical protein
MNSVIIPFVVGYLLDQLAAAGAALTNATVKTGFANWLGTASPWLKSHPAFEAMIINVANPLIDAALAACQDEPDLKAAVLALYGKNRVAAEAAFFALIKQAAPQLAPIFGMT